MYICKKTSNLSVFFLHPAQMCVTRWTRYATSTPPRTTSEQSLQMCLQVWTTQDSPAQPYSTLLGPSFISLVSLPLHSETSPSWSFLLLHTCFFCRRPSGYHATSRSHLNFAPVNVRLVSLLAKSISDGWGVRAATSPLHLQPPIPHSPALQSC